jgi:hypothetical protein
MGEGSGVRGYHSFRVRVPHPTNPSASSPLSRKQERGVVDPPGSSLPCPIRRGDFGEASRHWGKAAANRKGRSEPAPSLWNATMEQPRPLTRTCRGVPRDSPWLLRGVASASGEANIPGEAGASAPRPCGASAFRLASPGDIRRCRSPRRVPPHQARPTRPCGGRFRPDRRPDCGRADRSSSESTA